MATICSFAVRFINVAQTDRLNDKFCPLFLSAEVYAVRHC